MLNENSLIEQLPYFFKSVRDKKNVLLKDIDEHDIISFIPHLLSHKLEFLSFMSLKETHSLKEFYIYTRNKQLEVLNNNLQQELIQCAAIFLQGFPRTLQYSDILSPGMRTDIDIYIPPEHIKRFHEKCHNNGFHNYGFSDDEIFIVDKEAIKSFSSMYWADKDFTLTLPFECPLPTNLPIDFGDCYLPWLYRKKQWHLMVALEIHRCYTDNSEEKLIILNTEDWPETPYRRCNLSSLLYFNLIRLFKGVLAGEKRLRLLLDTACLFHDINIDKAIKELVFLIGNSKLKSELCSLCSTLAEMDTIFTPLLTVSSNKKNVMLSEKWRICFFNSLRLNLQEAL